MNTTTHHQLGEKHGAEAYHRCQPAVPALDHQCRDTITRLLPAETLGYLSAWLRGWHQANITNLENMELTNNTGANNK